MSDPLTVIAAQIQGLSISIARIEERMIAAAQVQDELRQLQTKHDHLDRRLVKVSGLNGDNGDMSHIRAKVAKNSDKISSLMLSRAMVAGYAAAAGTLGGIAATLIKLKV